MDLGLKGKVAIITGAGSQIGFGKGIAMVLAQEGCDIVATDMDLEGSKQTAADVEALGQKAIAIKADVTNKAEVNDMVKQALAKFDKIDILVNNAGRSSGSNPFSKKTEADLDSDININYMGMLYCTKAVLPNMLERKYGRIVNISSFAALTVAPTPISTYAAAKSAVLTFSKYLASEVGQSGINVNIIAPIKGKTGFFTASKSSPETLKQLDEMEAAGLTCTPQDVGNTVLYLVSDIARKINGQVLAL